MASSNYMLGLRVANLESTTDYLQEEIDNLAPSTGAASLSNNQTFTGTNTFDNQVQFNNYVPHCDTLPTQYNDLTTKKYVDSVVGTNSGTGINFYLEQTPSDITGYETLSSTFTYGTVTATKSNMALGTNIVSSFVSNENYPYIFGSSISAGVFTLALFAYVSSNTGNLLAYFTINKYDTLTSTTTLIATSGNSSDINGTNSTSPDLYHMTCSFPTTSFLSTDRLLIILYTVGTGMGSGVTITTLYQGSYYSYLQTPISSGSLLIQNNNWSGTNNFFNPVSLYQPTITTGPLTMPANSSILYGNTGTLSIGSSTDNITQTTGIRVPNYIDGVSLGTGIFIGSNHTSGFINMARGVVCSGSGTSSQISVEYLNARSNSTSGTIYLGDNLASGGKIYMGNNITGTGVITIGNANGVNQSLSGIWTVGQVSSNTFASSSPTATISLFTASSGAVNFCTTSTNTIAIGNPTLGVLQVPQNVRWVSNTNANLGSATATTTANIFTGITTGTINIGGTGITTGSINIASGASSGTITIGGSSSTINIGATTSGITTLGGASITLGLAGTTTSLTTPNSIVSLAVGTALSLFTTQTNTITLGGAGAININTTGTSFTRLGNSGSTQIGTSISLISTSNNIQQTTLTNNVSLYTLTTGNITLGTASTGTINLANGTGTTINLGTGLTTGAINIGSTTAGSTSQKLIGTWTVDSWNIGSSLTNNIQGVLTTDAIQLYTNTTSTVSIGSEAAVLNIGVGTNIGDINIGSGLQTGDTSIYSSGYVYFNNPIFCNYSTTTLSTAKAIGWVNNGNTQRTSGNQTAIGTYYVYNNGQGAAMTQLLEGNYLFCCNGELIIDNGTGTVGSIALCVNTNTTNATVSSTIYKNLIYPPTSIIGTNMYEIIPFSSSQVLTVPAANNNHYFGFRGTFNISATYTSGNVRFLIDSYSITRIG